MITRRSVRRQTFETDTFLHLDALYRTAVCLTMRRSLADDLVLSTMRRAYRSWHKPADAVSDKARLFRILARSFFEANPQIHKPGRYLSESLGSAALMEEGNGHHNKASIGHQQLPLLMMAPDVSVMGTIARLRPHSRLMMILLFREQFSYADIAYVTDLDENVVRSILTRLRRLVPLYLAKHAEPAAEADGDAEWTDHSVSLEYLSEAVPSSSSTGWMLQENCTRQKE
jgi:DNA-directed RNA polymerase specialized sigma24 family protein